MIHISTTGDVLDVVALPEYSIINDMASDGDSLYYTVNDELDRIVKVNQNTGAQKDLASNIAASDMVYTLAFDGAYLLMVDMVPSGNKVNRFSPATGAKVSSTPLGLEGWVTALAPAN